MSANARIAVSAVVEDRRAQEQSDGQAPPGIGAQPVNAEPVPEHLSSSPTLKPIAKPKPRLSHALFIRLDDDTHERLRNAAAQVDMPIAKFARLAVRNQLDAQERQAA